jgi:hypothetical protein
MWREVEQGKGWREKGKKEIAAGSVVVVFKDALWEGVWLRRGGGVFRGASEVLRVGWTIHSGRCCCFFGDYRVAAGVIGLLRRRESIGELSYRGSEFLLSFDFLLRLFVSIRVVGVD